MTSLMDWNDTDFEGGNGIIVAADENQEWLLPWWWKNYSACNSYPVTFFDIGMSKSALLWCEKRGKVLNFSFPQGWIKSKEELLPENIEKWENAYPGDLWNGRTAWFCKPYLALKSPYEHTVWMDIDCEVRAPLHGIFEFCNKRDGFSMQLAQIDNFSFFSAAVFICKRFSPIIKKWAEMIRSENGNYLGDENILMHLLKEEEFQIEPLPLIYNWPIIIPQSSDTIIRHFIGGYAKTKILRGLNV